MVGICIKIIHIDKQAFKYKQVYVLTHSNVKLMANWFREYETFMT